MNVSELNTVANVAVLCALTRAHTGQTTVHPNAHADNLIKHTIAHTCALGHNDAMMLHWYNFILLHYSIALLINIELILFYY